MHRGTTSRATTSRATILQLIDYQDNYKGFKVQKMDQFAHSFLLLISLNFIVN